jgi:hypothetical protein
LNNVEARKRFLIVSLTEIAKEPRVARQIRVLSEFGTVETIGFGDKPVGVSRHQSLDKPQGIKFGRYELKSIPMYGLTVFAMLLHLHALTGLLLPGAYQLRRKLGKTEFDVLIVRDLQPLVVVNKYFTKKPVWVDLPEFTPRQNESSKLWRILFAPFYRWAGKRLLPLAKKSTTVGNNIALEFHRSFGIEPIVIRNAANYHKPFKQKESSYDVVRFVHSGAAIRSRNLMQIMKGISLLDEDFQLDLYLVKTDQSYFGELSDFALTTNNCRVHEPVSQNNLIETLSEYDVSIVFIPPSNFNQTNSLPNKLFDAIQARLAILASPSNEIAAIVNKFEIGIVAEGFNANDIYAAAKAFVPESLNLYKSNSEVAARELSGEADDQRIRELIRDLTLEL